MQMTSRFIGVFLLVASVAGCDAAPASLRTDGEDQGTAFPDAVDAVGQPDGATNTGPGGADATSGAPDPGAPEPDPGTPKPDAGAAWDASPPGGCSDNLAWSADHETGDLSQYTAGGTYGGSYDSSCDRPSSGVVSAPEPAFRGQYAMKMTAPITAGKPACRQFRYEESSDGHSSLANGEHLPLYYSLWMRFPEKYEVKNWSNVIQFKSKTFDKSTNDAFWVLELRNRKDASGNDSMYLMLRYKGIYPGPSSGEGTGLKHYHTEAEVSVPADKWFNLTIFLSQSTNASGQQSNYDGQIIVWQDGVEIYNMDNVATRYPDSWNEWSVNVYAATNGVAVGGSNADFVLYVDDVKISKQPIMCP